MFATNHPLRLWRAANKVTLEALAGKAGDVSASHLSEIERGLDTPSAKLATRLSAATIPDGGEAPAVSIQQIIEAAPIPQAAE